MKIRFEHHHEFDENDELFYYVMDTIDDEPVVTAEGNWYTFKHEVHAECFAASLNLGLKSLEQEGGA